MGAGSLVISCRLSLLKDTRRRGTCWRQALLPLVYYKNGIMAHGNVWRVPGYATILCQFGQLPYERDARIVVTCHLVEITVELRCKLVPQFG